MSSAAVSSHSGTGSLSLMSCVRESSPLQDYECDTEKIVASKKKFWNPKKWFKRKNKVSDDVVEINESTSTSTKETLRSRSTSELSIDEENTRRRSTTSMHQGLSQSHDSVFHSPNSGSDIGLDAGRSTSSLSISQPHIDRVQTELSERLRLRRGRGDTSEDDEGLPHSPCNSPTTTDGGLHDKTAIRDLPTKSHSTCSDGSLLSMGSSEMDEDSFGLHSRHSSRLSLHEKKTIDSDLDLELDTNSPSVAPLNHSAAHHRVAVRPKRTHGAPRRKRVPQLSSALPATPEVNEESSRSLTPDNVNNKVTRTEQQVSSITIINEYSTKCSSLPPGLIPSTTNDENNKLNRSKSNVDSKLLLDHFDTLYEEKEDNKTDKSFFDRIFPRKSAKKNKRAKEKNDDNDTPPVKMISVEQKPIITPRNYCGPASRQRIQPIDIPASPEDNRRLLPPLKSSPDKGFLSQSPPFHAELETRFKQQQQQRHLNIISASPPKSLPPLILNNNNNTTPPISPKSLHNNTVITEQIQHYTTRSNVIKKDDLRNKIKLAGLSTLQQRVMSMNDDEDESDNNSGFKSLTDLPLETKPIKPITKSHSFKSYCNNNNESSNKNHTDLNEKDKLEKVRAASLDSVKNLESDVKFEVKKFERRFEEKKKQQENDDFGITISGPSHTAIVNITTNQESTTTNNTFAKTETEMNENGGGGGTRTVSVKESQVSITKIQMKRETITNTSTNQQIPEFLNKQLNKVEAKPLSNIIFSTNISSPPRIIEEQSRPKLQFEQIMSSPRKFSQDNLEIIEKKSSSTSEDDLLLLEETSLNNNNNSQTQNITRFKKNEKSSIRKSSMVSITPETPKKQFIKHRSMSLDSLKNDSYTTTTPNESDKSSQDSVNEKSDVGNEKTVDEPIVLRRKSIIMQNKKDEEPELMKVFARRSLKLKDIESEQVSDQIDSMLEQNYKAKDSDKENQEDINNKQDEQKRKSKEEQTQRRKSFSKSEETKQQLKVPLSETKITEITKNFSKESSQIIESNVQLRKTVNNNIFSYQRSISFNQPKKDNNSKLIEQQQQRKTDNWIKTEQNEINEIKEEILPDIITEDILTKPKNFNQRKAEWEKRAQQAQKKNVP